MAEGDGDGCLVVLVLVLLGGGWGVHSWWEGRQEKAALAAEFAHWREIYCHVERIEPERRCFRCKDEGFAIRQMSASDADRGRLKRIATRLGGWQTIEHGVTVCE